MNWFTKLFCKKPSVPPGHTLWRGQLWKKTDNMVVRAAPLLAELWKREEKKP